MSPIILGVCIPQIPIEKDIKANKAHIRPKRKNIFFFFIGLFFKNVNNIV